jgi:hypothetical protein
MHSAEDSAAIAVRILQRREQERAVEAAERDENDRLEVALAASRNEVASLRGYTAALEARLNGLYAEMAQPEVPLRPRGIMRRLVRASVVALLGAVGVLLFQMKTPLGARLTESLRKQSLGGLAADVSQAVRRQFHSPTSVAPATPQPTPPPAPVVAPPAMAVAPPAPVVAPPAPPRSETRRHVPSAPAKHAQPHKEVQGRAVQEAVIPACSDSDPLCGISKRPH